VTRPRGRRVVDLSDARTWPAAARAAARDVAYSIDPEAWWYEADDRPFVDALSGAYIRCYHATRLTDRESESIRRHGLQPLTSELVQRRIAEAVADGYLTLSQAEALTTSGHSNDPNRRDRLFLFTNAPVLRVPHQVRYLLSMWGGEGINMGVGWSDEEGLLLRSIGTPSVVVALFDPAADEHSAHPGLVASAAARIRQRTDGTNVTCKFRLSGDRIEAIEQPGSWFWARFVPWWTGT
jgi:hypothetical protein